MELAGRVAVVTGASRGIGRGIALELGKRGMKVVVAARTEQAGGALPGTIHETAEQIRTAGGEAMAIRCDITKDEQVEELINRTAKEYGRLDLLINNAAIDIIGSVADLSMKRWDLSMNVNLRAVVLACKLALPIMQRQGSGQIINITSLWGRNWVANQAAYCVSKAAMERFTVILAEEVKSQGIIANAFGPAGGVDTEGLMKAWPNADRSRWVSVQDFARSVAEFAAAVDIEFTGRVLYDTEFLGYTEFKRQVR